MKITAVKNYLLAAPKLLALLVVTIVELITAFLDLQISKCRHRLQFGVWPQLRTQKTTDKLSVKTSDSVCPADREPAIRQILSCWVGKSNYTVARDRRTFEATKWGKQAVKNNPDRHLYAVLRPTREENLERIANALREMNDEAFNRVARIVRTLKTNK